MEGKAAYHVITTPQIGVNELLLTLSGWLVPDGGEVTAGDGLCALESTKTAFEVEAEHSGFVVHLVQERQQVKVSSPLALIGPDLGHLRSVRSLHPPVPAAKERGDSRTTGQRATKKAVKLAQELGVDLLRLKGENVIREADVLAAHRAAQQGCAAKPLSITRRTQLPPVLIYGAGQGGMTVKECLDAGGTYEPVCFVSDDFSQVGTPVMGLPVFHAAQLDALAALGVTSFFPAVGEGRTRVRLLRDLEQRGFTPVNAIHPTAYVADSARLGRGVFLKVYAVVETEATLGDAVIVDNGAVIAHHCLIGDVCHLAPRAALGGGVTLGTGCIIGVGASIASDLRLGDGVVVSPGSAALKDIPEGAIIEGVPGRVIGQRKSWP